MGDLDPRNCRFSPSKVGTFRPWGPGLLAIAGLGNEMHWTRPERWTVWENILAKKIPWFDIPIIYSL